MTGAGVGFDSACLFFAFQACAHLAFMQDIDLRAFSSRGVYYSNTPMGPAMPTSDSAFILILAVLRNTILGDRVVRRGAWIRDFQKGINPSDAIIGLIGLGRIGKMVAQKLSAFGVKKIIYFTRTRLGEKEEKALGLEYKATLDDLLQESDVVSLHLPQNKDTKHFIGTREFAMFKQGARLVNTARGPIVDEEALVQALKDQQISGAALDVFEHDAKVHPYLMESDMVLLQPHVAVGACCRQLVMCSFG